MKSEKIRRAIGEIDEDIIEAAETEKASVGTRKTWVRWGAVAAAVVLLLTGTLTFSKLQKQHSPVVDNSTAAGEKTDDEIKKDNADIRVIWADNAATENNSESEELTKWGKFHLVSGRLYKALEAGGKDDAFAILVRPVTDENFICQGKTMADYYSDMCNEKNLPDQLIQLLKEGDALKYGTALYETGTPDGEKWYKSLYEERINFYGDAILRKYIVNGEFLKDKLEQDIETAKNSTEATDGYLKALAVYLDQIAAAVHGSLPPKTIPEQDCIIMYLTKEQFSSFEYDHAEEWVFDLAAKDDETAVVTYGVDE